MRSTLGNAKPRQIGSPRNNLRWRLRIGAVAVAGLTLGLLYLDKGPAPGDELDGSHADLRDSDPPAQARVRTTEEQRRSGVPGLGDDALRTEVVEWVCREHPDARQYADYLAESVCLLRRMLAVDSPTNDELAEILALYQRWVRTADTNSDGSSFDDLSGLASARQYLAADQSPQVQAILDANQDGTISDEEWAQVAPERLKLRLLGRVASRQKLLQWDANGDGVLGPDERAAGDAQLASTMIVQPDGLVRRRRRGEVSQSMDDQAGVLADLAAMRGPAAAGDTGDALESLRALMVSREYIRAAGIGDVLVLADTLGAVVRNSEGTVAGEASRSAPVEIPPEVAQRQAEIIEQARKAGMSELAARAAVQGQDSRRAAARSRVNQIEDVAAGAYHMLSKRFDADGDGTVGEAEWAAGVSDAAARNDAAVVRLYYDADADGVVGTGDVVRFIEWLGSQSSRADINEDGRLDHRDLQQFLNHYGG